MNADERDDAGATLLFVKGCRKPNPIFFLQKYGFESMWITRPHSLSAVRAEREASFFCIDLGAQDILQWGQKRCLRDPSVSVSQQDVSDVKRIGENLQADYFLATLF